MKNLQLARFGLIPCALCLVQPLRAAPHTPSAGSAERRAIMDAMRKVVAKNHRKKIIFITDHLKVEKGWAYFGGRFDYTDGTHPSEELMGGNTSALLHYEKKAWRVKRLIHNGDVAEPDFIASFPKAPKAIFKRVYR